MMKNKRIARPVGLSEAVGKIESICAFGAGFKRRGIKPHNFFIPLENGNGQTELLNFMADMYESCGVRRFGGLDTCLEYTLDGTMAQLNNIFFEINTSAVYTNFFEGIIAFDISALADSLHEKQTEYFLSRAAKCAEYATLVFFVSPKIKNLQAIAETVCTAVRDVEIICVKPYTNAELAEIALRGIEEKGVGIVSREEACGVIEKAVEALGIKKACETESVIYTAVKNADYSGFMPDISASKLARVFSECFEKVRGETK